jgi:RNA polymerase sigma-70 factor (ECF subfamily)
LRVVDLDERSWLPRHRRGDPLAFSELLAAYRAPVYGYLARCGIASAARDDLFQDIFLKIHLHADSYQPSRALRPWIFTIVANTLRNHVRDEKARAAGRMRYAARVEVEASEDTESLVVGEQTAEWIERAVRALPLPQREVLLLVRVAGLSLR